MTSVVNGYVCTSGCDVAAARKGRDPQHPNDDPVVARDRAVREGRIPGDTDGRDRSGSALSALPDAVSQAKPGRLPDGVGELIDRLV